MKRRDILKYTALMTGATISAPLASLILSGCQLDSAKKEVPYQLQFFTEENFKFLQTVIDTILPKTDSPAATEVKVHQLIDQFIGQTYTKEEQMEHRTKIVALFDYLRKDKKFEKKDALTQLETLKEIEATKQDDLSTLQQTLVELKQQTIAIYLSTETIATNFLNYLPVPGKYEACISLEETGGKAWAL